MSEQQGTQGGLNKIQQHNLQFLLNSEYPNDGYGAESVLGNFAADMQNQEFERTGDMELFDRDGPDEQSIARELVQFVKPLSRAKITKAITGSSFGKIFKLSNDHILKIFLGGVDADSDIAWFKKSYDMLHRGKGKKTTLPVYDWEWGSNKLPSHPDHQVGYVEMAEVIPLDKFLKNTGRGDPDGVISQAKAIFKQIYYIDGIKDYNEITDRIEQHIPDEEAIEPMTLDELYAMIQAFYDMVKMGFKLSDVAARNMGVLRQDPDTIVIFDR